MNTAEQARQAHDAWLQSAWRDDDEAMPGIVPDGHKITVSMSAMDSVQQALASDTDTNGGLWTDKATADAKATEAERLEADAVQRHQDHFDGLQDGREAQAADAAYAEYNERISNAWRQS